MSLKTDASKLSSQSNKDLIQSLLGWGTEMLSLDDCAAEDPNREARLLLLHVCGLSSKSFLPDHIEDQAVVDYYSCIERRSKNEPFAYIVGEQGFWTLDLDVNSSTLIPRADTETLIELLLEQRPNKDASYRILDLGTGTGCLLLAALSEYKNASGLGADISADAVKLAQSNALKNKLSSRAKFIQSSWGEKVEGKFDILLSNPPYINAEDIKGLESQVRCYEPDTALSGGNDGLEAYRLIFNQLPDLLNKEGIAIFEIGYDQYPAILELAKERGFEFVTAKKDLGGITRAVAIKQK